MWYLIFTKKQKLSTVSKEREPFRRNDLDTWTYPRALVTQFFFIPRFLVLFVYLFSAAIIVSIISLGTTTGEKIHPTRLWLITRVVDFFIRLFTFTLGVYRMESETVNADYRKWLGPDWKPVYNGHGI